MSGAHGEAVASGGGSSSSSSAAERARRDARARVTELKSKIEALQAEKNDGTMVDAMHEGGALKVLRREKPEIRRVLRGHFGMVYAMHWAANSAAEHACQRRAGRETNYLCVRASEQQPAEAPRMLKRIARRDRGARIAQRVCVCACAHSHMLALTPPPLSTSPPDIPTPQGTR